MVYGKCAAARRYPTRFSRRAVSSFQPHEVKIDKGTGLLKTTYGVSVDADATRVVHFGGAYHVVALPDELTIIQRGRRAQHYEIVPAVPITPERYQELLNQVELELVLAE